MFQSHVAAEVDSTLNRSVSSWTGSHRTILFQHRNSGGDEFRRRKDVTKISPSEKKTQENKIAVDQNTLSNNNKVREL